MRLAGKRAIITGGAHGLGAAIARRFAAEGARVCIADLDRAAGTALAEDLADGSADAWSWKLDVQDAAAWSALVQQVMLRWDGVDVLVNNAAIASGLTSIEDRSPDDWDRFMAINLRGPFLATRAVLPLFRSQGQGVVVNVTSVAAAGQSGIMDPAYACSKAGLAMLTRVTAAQHAEDGVRCNAVAPGPIDSALARSAYPDQLAMDRRLSRVPMARFAEPDEVAAAVIFLASDEAAYVNGAVLPVDGGALVQ